MHLGSLGADNQGAHRASSLDDATSLQGLEARLVCNAQSHFAR